MSLRKLLIQNLALIERIEVAFCSGLNVITGESGAGKSLIIRALSLALGDRADRDDLGDFADKIIIEAHFEFKNANNPAVLTLNKILEITKTENKSALIIRREISQSGRSRIFVNDNLIALADLKKLAPLLCRIQGQAASVNLRNDEYQLATIDKYAMLEEKVALMAERFDSWQAVKRDKISLISQRENLDNERELLLFQKHELERASLAPDEEDKLIAEKKRLDSAEKLIRDTEQIAQTLDADQSPLETLAELARLAKEIAETDNQFGAQSRQFESNLIQLEDLRQSVSSYRSSLYHDDQRLEEINSRLAEIYKLKMKYGGSVSAALKTLDEITSRLTNLPDTGEKLAELTARECELREQYSELALENRKKRMSAEKRLSGDVVSTLNDLAISNPLFDFKFNWTVDEDGITVKDKNKEITLKPERHGLENGEFYFSANPGEESRPLARVASGGELSRALLALDVAATHKTASNAGTGGAVTVYDEVDSGIGGKTATAVGKKLKELSTSSQVIVVTHLRQVASFGDIHILVEKNPDRLGGRNSVDVRCLTKRESREQLARMVDMEPVS